MKLKMLLTLAAVMLASSQSFATLDATSRILDISAAGTVTAVCKFSSDASQIGGSAVLDDGNAGIKAQPGVDLSDLQISCNNGPGFSLQVTSLNGSRLKITGYLSSIPFQFALDASACSKDAGAPACVPTAPAAASFSSLVQNTATTGQLLKSYPGGATANQVSSWYSIAANAKSIAGSYSDTVHIVLSPN